MQTFKTQILVLWNDVDGQLLVPMGRTKSRPMGRTKSRPMGRTKMIPIGRLNKKDYSQVEQKRYLQVGITKKIPIGRYNKKIRIPRLVEQKRFRPIVGLFKNDTYW